MANGWTLERRQRQAAMIRNWKPWERSTGARTLAGKAKSAKNAIKHGMKSAASLAQWRELREFMTKCNQTEKEVREFS